MDIFIQLTLNGLIAGSIYALVALGFNLSYGTMRFFDLGYSALIAVGGYTVFFLSRQIGLPLPISILIGTIMAGIAGYIIYLLVYVPLRKRKASNMALLVASLGIFTVIQAVIGIFFSSQFRTLSGPVDAERIFHVFGGSITRIQVIILGTSIVVMFALAIIFRFTTFGKSIRAIGDSEEVSKIVGINTSRIIGYVLFIGSAIAGLVGILVGFDTGITPTMGFSLLLKGVVASIIGGVGNVYGGVVGALFLGLIENYGIWHISTEWKDAIAFGLLILFLYFRPQGIFRK
ncbi:MAG: branched-chain amino acid ABC transporter permease [Candidatus Andersenbacteria bacterium]|nr:branched-chain amino acid ABC transporter permease [Candidatus Andersenbacteria bacterium]